MQIADEHTRNRILALLFVGVLMAALDIAIVAPALPAMQRQFHINERLMAWIYTTYVLFNLMGTPLMAKLADVHGRRLLYIIDVLLFAAGSLVVALSFSIHLVLVGRAIQGFGSSGIFPVAAAVIGDTFPPEKRGRALGIVGAVFGVAFLIGPVIGGIVLHFLNWHWLFLLNIPIGIGLIIGSLRLLPNKRVQSATGFDWKGFVVIGSLLGSLTFGLSQLKASTAGMGSNGPPAWPFILIAFVLVPVFWHLEKQSLDPILRVTLFQRRQVRLVAALALGAGLGESVLVFVPALLVQAFHVSASTASFMLLPAVVAMTIGSPMAGFLLDRRGSRFVVLLGSFLLALGMYGLGLLSLTLFHFYSAAILVGLGLSALLGAPLRYIMLNEALPEERAAAQAVIRIFTATGQLSGGALMGAIIASLGGNIRGFQYGYLLMGIIATLLIILGLGLKSRSAELTIDQEVG